MEEDELELAAGLEAALELAPAVQAAIEQVRGWGSRSARGRAREAAGEGLPGSCCAGPGPRLAAAALRPPPR